jgi:hypothetical protein
MNFSKKNHELFKKSIKTVSKKLLLFLALIVGFVSTQAQNNPFAEYGYTPKVATLSQGQFNESFDNDTIVQIGSVLFNTKSKQIVALVEYDTLYSEATLEPDIVSRWMSPDPLAAKYPGLSPYNFVDNNPITFIDPDGREIYIYSSDKSKKPILYQPNMKVIGDAQQQQTIAALNYISNSGSDSYNIVNKFANDKSQIYIEGGNWSDHLSSTNFKLSPESPIAGNIPWSPIGGIVTDDGGRQSAANGLLHELAHFYFVEYDPLGVYAEQPNRGDFASDEAFNNAYDSWEQKWTDYANEKGYDNIEDYWIIEGPEKDFSNQNNESTRSSHSYKEEFKAKDYKSLEGPTKSEVKK